MQKVRVYGKRVGNMYDVHIENAPKSPDMEAVLVLPRELKIVDKPQGIVLEGDYGIEYYIEYDEYDNTFFAIDECNDDTIDLECLEVRDNLN